jgi:hypothetical protein
MERELAVQLIQISLEISDHLAKAYALMPKLNDLEKEPIERAVGDMLQDVYIKLMRPAIRQYPDLDPDPR